MYSVTSAADPWLGLPDFGEFRVAPSGSQVASQLVPGERTHVIVTYGQSNAGDFGYGVPYTASSKVQMFNLRDGGVYRASDPVLGANGGVVAGALCSPWPRLGDKLIADGQCQRVIFACMAVGGTSTADWAGVGTYDVSGRIPYMIRRLKAAGLTPTAILRHQGEADPPLGTDRATYAARVRAEIKLFRDAGFACPAWVALATYWANVNVPGSATVGEVRTGQVLACSDALAIYQGPDTDQLGAAYRGDSAHMNAAGLDTHAGMWVPIIRSRVTL